MESLEKLQEPLTLSDIEFRVGSTSINYKKVSILAYKNARVDMNRLDSVCGLDGWENKYQRDSKGVLQCGIGIYSKKHEKFIWKWSNGVESRTESEKGEYSDALKRAGFVWGIGRELYDVPDMWLPLKDKEFRIDDRGKSKKLKTTGYFRPNDWDWEFDVKEGKFLAKDWDGDYRIAKGYKTSTWKRE